MRCSPALRDRRDCQSVISSLIGKLRLLKGKGTVPEGPVKIARQFTGGIQRAGKTRPSAVGTTGTLRARLINRRPTSRKITPVTKHHRSVVAVQSRQRRKRRLQRQLSDRLLNLDQTLLRPFRFHRARTQNRIEETNASTRLLLPRTIPTTVAETRRLRGP